MKYKLQQHQSLIKMRAALEFLACSECRLCLSSYQYKTSLLILIRPYANEGFSLLTGFDPCEFHMDSYEEGLSYCPGNWRIFWFSAHLMFCSEVLTRNTICSWGSQFFLQSLVWMCVCFSPPAVIFRWTGKRPVCSARSVCFTVNELWLFRPNQPAKGLCLFHLIAECWLVVFTVSQEQSEMFRLMFVVNSWVYLVYRRHFFIVRHQNRFLLFLWDKRGWFWPFVCTYRHLCLNSLTYVCVLSFLLYLCCFSTISFR